MVWGSSFFYFFENVWKAYSHWSSLLMNLDGDGDNCINVM